MTTEHLLDSDRLARVDRAYDSPPLWYDIRGFFILCLSYRSTVWAQVAFFGNNMGPRHLEAAIGTATLFSIILWWRKLRGIAPVETVGFDYAEAMLEGAKARLGRDKHVSLVRRDVAQLEFPSNSFDTANIANAVHCFPDVDAGLREVARVLKPGGTLAVNALLTPRRSSLLGAVASRINTWGVRKGILNQVFTETAINSHLTSAGFEVVRAQRSGNTFNILARKPIGGGS